MDVKFQQRGALPWHIMFPKDMLPSYPLVNIYVTLTHLLNDVYVNL